MNAPVTRRALLGATAAVGAVVALPMGASALAGSDHPDAALFVLLDVWGPARAAADTAGDRSEALWLEFIDLEPERPAALHFSGADGLNCGFEVERLSDGRHVTFYGLQDVEKLQGMPLPRRCVETYTPHPDLPNDRLLHRTWIPDERRIARRAEVIAAHDTWMVERQAVKDRLGMDAADDAEEEAFRVLWEVEAEILSTLPATTAGLVAKARWASWDGLPKATAEVWAKQVTGDVIAMAERSGVAS